MVLMAGAACESKTPSKLARARQAPPLRCLRVRDCMVLDPEQVTRLVRTIALSEIGNRCGVGGRSEGRGYS